MAKKEAIRKGTRVFINYGSFPRGALLTFDRWYDDHDGNDLSFWTTNNIFYCPRCVRIISVTSVQEGKQYMLHEPCGEFPAGSVFVCKRTQSAADVQLQMSKNRICVTVPLSALMECVTHPDDPLSQYQPVFAASNEVMDLIKKLCTYQGNNEGHALLKRIQSICATHPVILEDTKVYTTLESCLFSIAWTPVGRHRSVTQSALLAVAILGQIGNEKTVTRIENSRTNNHPYQLDEAFLRAVDAIKNRLKK